jgi:hypothetical protein
MKFLVPMARAKRSDCVRLVEALATMSPSTRDLEALYAAWTSGNKQTRELVVTQPSLVLRARAQMQQDKGSAKTPARRLLDDFGILIGTSRRARARVVQGLIEHLLPTEQKQAQHAAQQARWECNALFRAAAALLGVVTETVDPSLCSVEPSPDAR